MGCFVSKHQQKIVFQNYRTHQKNQIKIQKKTLETEPHPEDQDQKQIHGILLKVTTQDTHRKPQNILQEIVKLSQQCIHFYNQHDIDKAYQLLKKIQSDIKEFQIRGYQIEMSKHFKQEFIRLSRIIQMQYQDMINYNNEILKDGWKLQKDKKNFKVYSRVEGQTVGIKLESVLDVPFQNMIAVLIQPQYYGKFLPFITSSKQLKNVRRNCKLGSVEMSFPIISDREAYFQGVVYNRLNHKIQSEQELFMYTRSFHNRKDLQQIFDYEVVINKKCVQLDYKYVAVKYVPISQTSGKMIMGVNIDLKLNMMPLKILEMVSISFSQDFFDNIVRISENFKGSLWDEGVKKDPQLFQFTKRVKDQYLNRQKQLKK